MKTKLLIFVNVLLSCYFHAQDSLKIEEYKPGIITFSPQNTNGIAFGIMDDYQSNQKINGINLQANPISLIYPLIPKAIPVPTEERATVTVNGLHISTGGMMDGNKLNGIGISIYHHARVTNGFSFSFYNNTSGVLNGLHLSWLSNSAETGNGMLIAMSNSAENFNGVQVGAANENLEGKGLQIGVFNKGENFKGVQLGLINKNKNGRNFQIGFWNKNSKRTLPLINF